MNEQELARLREVALRTARELHPNQRSAPAQAYSQQGYVLSETPPKVDDILKTAEIIFQWLIK